MVVADDPPSRQPIDLRFERALDELARDCEKQRLETEAAMTRAWLVRRDPGRQYFFLPDAMPGAKPATASEPSRQWHAKFLDIRRARAAELFEYARGVVELGNDSEAFRVLHEILREDPDHAEARRILGYRGSPGKWSRGAKPKATAGRTPHQLFGWQRGKYWTIDSDHFQISTNHSGKAGTDLAERLEQVHDVWRQLFHAYWSAPGALSKQFEGRSAASGSNTARRFQVVLFRNRDEYVSQLAQAEPLIAQTVGYYSDRRRISLFYSGDESLETTRYHESTHQFFQESRAVPEMAGKESNFWIVEGAAMYMESLEIEGDHATLGGWDSERMQFARYQARNNNLYLPLERVVAYGRDAMQKDEHIRQIYNQAAGLTHFLMDGDGGRHRESLQRYLRAVYTNEATAGTLAELTRLSFDEIDTRYQDYLNVADGDLLYLRPPRVVRHLSLGHTDVSDEGLRHVAGYDRLRWLDLAFTNTTDDGVTRLEGARSLKQLGLEKTAVTDRSLAIVGRLEQLEELDLAGTRITDQGLAALAGLRNLKLLWLSGTAVTDAGLTHLEPLSKLETLHLEGTRVTPAGLSRLRVKLPRLKE